VACRNLVTRLGRRLSLAGIVVTVGGVAVLAAIVAHSGTAASAAELAPARTLSLLTVIAIGALSCQPGRPVAATGARRWYFRLAWTMSFVWRDGAAQQLADARDSFVVPLHSGVRFEERGRDAAHA
jgi:hypothetical protein